MKTKEQNGMKEKLQGFVQANKEIIYEFMSYIIETGNDFLKNPRIIMSLSKCLFSLIILAPEIFIHTKQKLILKLTQKQEVGILLETQFDFLMKDVDCKFDTLNEDKFLKNFKILIHQIFCCVEPQDNDFLEY